MKILLNHIADIIGENIINYNSISGGDISSAYLIKTPVHQYFLKVNPKKEAFAMFLAEKQGLDTIALTQTIATPKVFHCEQYDDKAFLLIEHIITKTPTSKDFETFAYQLACMHKITANEFGWDQDNFIGSLHQANHKHQNWINFYLEERILPQLQLAYTKNLLTSKDMPEKETLFKVCAELFNEIKPSLLHGDLWSGNYIIASNGTPYLIDPAVYFGHHEVDIAMTKLFGGFANSFYQSYYEHIGITQYTQNRIELYQLYYLLVHLNLFGNSYYQAVKRILTKYF